MVAETAGTSTGDMGNARVAISPHFFSSLFQTTLRQRQKNYYGSQYTYAHEFRLYSIHIYCLRLQSISMKKHQRRKGYTIPYTIANN